MKTLKIGVVIADDMEYAPLKNLGGQDCPYFFRDGHIFTYKTEEKEVIMHAVCSGIGKANAAAAAMYLIDNGCDMILNTGLSGGMNGILRGEITLCDQYTEYDFDLTPLGYKKGEKPSQKNVYNADEKLLAFFKELLPNARIGMAVTGDRFVSDDCLRAELLKRYSPMSCDMESAAVAGVCSMANVPFLALRRISDDAGADASLCYTDMNENEKFDLAVIVLDAVKSMLNNDLF
ncbi:MAG: 5'-methylthioadenosine/S-adenosylhomocysteine nucleosidase [Clostridia bacterium]|nr:5'-methylthioadenosine/S-adenosylhomocysteine nucleosidase [Clostridia bacterium]